MRPRVGLSRSKVTSSNKVTSVAAASIGTSPRPRIEMCRASRPSATAAPIKDPERLAQRARALAQVPTDHMSCDGRGADHPKDDQREFSAVEGKEEGKEHAVILPPAPAEPRPPAGALPGPSLCKRGRH